MISLVNGYICKSWQDVTEALQGKQPPAKAGELPYSSGSDGKVLAFLDRPVAPIDASRTLANKTLANAPSDAPASSSYDAPRSDGQILDQASAVLQVADSSQASAGSINRLV